MSRLAPYVPMEQKPLAGEAEIAAMHAKLAAKIQPKVEVITQTPADTGGHSSIPEPAAEQRLPPIEWEKPSDPLARLIFSKCGKWRVRKWHAEHYGWRYQAESLTENLWWYQCGPSCASFAEVRKHIEASRK